VLLGEVGGELVVAGLDRRVGGEHRARRRLGDGGPGLHVVLLHPVAGPFQDGEGRVALVEVDDAGGDAQRPQGPRAAHAQEKLLLDAHAVVAAV